MTTANNTTSYIHDQLGIDLEFCASSTATGSANLSSTTHRALSLSSSAHDGTANGHTPTVPADDRHNSIGAASSTASSFGARPQEKESGSNDGNSSRYNRIAQQASAKSEDINAPPAWTELKTKAGKERKRLPLACIACRRKKIRCSGEHPACKHCLRSRIPCVYKVTTRKAAPRTDYMAMLDKRLKRMEERVIKIIPKEDQGILAVTGRAVVKPSASTPLARTSTSKKRAADQSLDDLELWSRADTATGEQSASINNTTVAEPVRTHEGDEQSLLREGVDKLPSKELQEHLAEVFFDCVYGQSYHLLHKPSFMRRLARGEIAPVLVLAVCAISARFSDHPDVRTDPAFLRGEEWATAARDISTKRYDSPNITLLIVYLILTLHEFGTCQGVRSWMFSGMAQRMAYAMQLHHDLARDPCIPNVKTDLSYTDREIRRRVMWACFMTDRYCSSGTERPTFISVEHLRLQLPIREIYFQMELTGPTEDLSGQVQPLTVPADEQLSDAQDNMGVAAYIIRIVAIWGDCIYYYNMGGKTKDPHAMWDDRSRFAELRRAIRSWLDNLPDALRYRPDNLAAHASEKIANQFIFMHVIYHQTALFVNRFALPLAAAEIADTEGVPANFVQDSAKAALEAADRVSALVHDGMNHNLVAPFAGYAAFFSSTVHIQGAFSNNKALVAASNKHLTWNINYLTKMKKHWGMFHFMTENLRDLYRKHVDAARHTAQGSANEKTNEPIFQYGDWFDRYPHGVNGADYDEPQSGVKKEPGADAGLGQHSDLQTVEEFFSKLSPSHAAAARTPKVRKTSKKQIAVSSDDATVAAQLLQDNDLGQHQASQLQQAPNGLYDALDEATGLITSPLYDSTLDQQPAYASQLDGAYLDRQSALIYAGFDPSMAMTYSLAGATYDPNNANMNFNLGLGSMPDVSAGQNTYQASASGGWLMPLNLDAAALAEASGPFSTGGFDWTTQFELADMQANSLTPRTQMELDVANARSGLHGG